MAPMHWLVLPHAQAATPAHTATQGQLAAHHAQQVAFVVPGLKANAHLVHSRPLVHGIALRVPVGNMQRLRHKQVVQYVRLAPSAVIHSRSRSLVLVAITLLEVLCSVLYAQQGTAALLQVLYRSSVPMEQSPRWARLIARSATGAMHAQILLECQLHVILAHTAMQDLPDAHHAQQANRVQIQQTSL